MDDATNIKYPNAVTPKPDDTRRWLEDMDGRGQLVLVMIPNDGKPVYKQFDSSLVEGLRPKGLTTATEMTDPRAPDETRFCIFVTSGRAAHDGTYKLMFCHLTSTEYTVPGLLKVANKSKLKNALIDSNMRSTLPLLVVGKSDLLSDSPVC